MDDFWRVYGTRHPFHHVYVERKLKDGYDVDAVVQGNVKPSSRDLMAAGLCG